jgi:ABC-type polysaccharide/polyol phosphate export permease
MELVVLSVVLLIAGNMVLPWLPLVVVAAFLLALFATGIGLALAAANVYFRDLTYLWTIIAQAWFFMTPLVYPPSVVRERVPGWLFRLFDNAPMAVTARVFRNLVYDLRFPDWADWGLMAGYGVVALLAGWWVFTRLEGRFAEEL